MLFRIVVDEDVVPGVPPFQSYHHFGSEILIDGLRDTGCIIINPSYVEKKFIQKTKSSVKAHLPGSYITGLRNIKEMTVIFENSTRNSRILDTSKNVAPTISNSKNIRSFSSKCLKNGNICVEENQIILTNISMIVDFSVNNEHAGGVFSTSDEEDEEEQEYVHQL